MSIGWAPKVLWLAVGLFSAQVSPAHASNPPGLPPACETSAIVSLRVAAFRGTAAPGVAEDQYRLASAIEAAAHGCSDGVVDGIREAIGWYEAAGSKGHADAAYRVGRYYFDGRVELQIAALWFHMAAERGHVAAQARLGMCYLKGSGVERDLLAAAHWLGRAAVQAMRDVQPR